MDQDDLQLMRHSARLLAQHLVIMRDALLEAGISWSLAESLLIEWWKMQLTPSMPDFSEIFKSLGGE
jgi:hypothetical protein